MLHEIEGGAHVEDVSQEWVNEHNHDLIEWLTGFAIASDDDDKALNVLPLTFHTPR